MYSRTIKVWDLLTKPGTDDMIIRTKQTITSLPNITSAWIDLTMKIASVNHEEVWIYIIGLKASFNETCDYSGEDFIRPLILDESHNEILRFAIKPDDEWYPINARDNTIELMEPITQLIRLHEPVSKIAPWYQFPSEEDNDLYEVNKIVFK